jgi:hypothetical protein
MHEKGGILHKLFNTYYKKEYQRRKLQIPKGYLSFHKSKKKSHCNEQEEKNIQ